MQVRSFFFSLSLSLSLSHHYTIHNMNASDKELGGYLYGILKYRYLPDIETELKLRSRSPACARQSRLGFNGSTATTVAVAS